MGNELEKFGGKHKNLLLIAGVVVGVLALVMARKGSTSGTQTNYVPIPGQASSNGGTSAITDLIQQGQQATSQQLQSIVDAGQQSAQDTQAALQQQQQIDAANSQGYAQALQSAQQQTDSLTQAISSFQNQMSANNSQLYQTLQTSLAQRQEQALPQAVYAPAQQQAQGGSTVARDGQSLSSQSSDVQKLFFGTYGNSAAIDWVNQHNAAIG